VRWKGTPEFGDELRFFGTAEPIAPPRNPGEFDMRSYLARRDVRRILFVRYPEDGVLIRHGGGNPILHAAQKSRAWMQNALCRGLENAPGCKVLSAGSCLASGTKHPKTSRNRFNKPARFTFWLSPVSTWELSPHFYGCWPWSRDCLASGQQRSLSVTLFYAAITGLHVSSVRAAVMASILLGGIFFDRKVFVLNSLAAAAFFLLCWDTTNSFRRLPTLVRRRGRNHIVAELFLDFAALGRARSFFATSLLRGPKRLMHAGFEWLFRGASVSLAAWIGSLPFILWYFYIVTPISLLRT